MQAITINGESPVAVEFTLDWPQKPRPAALDTVIGEFEALPAIRRRKLLRDIECHYTKAFFNLGAGKDDVELPRRIAKLSRPLRRLIDFLVTPEFKKYHFTRGLLTRTPEELQHIADTKKADKEDALRYAHIPLDGLQGPDGNMISREECIEAIDKGWLAPNPESMKAAPAPDLDLSGVVPVTNKKIIMPGTDIIQP